MNRKTISVFLILVMLSELCMPTIAFALTDGPSQPETQGFSPINNNDMVNLFTGDFSYNIPLLDVGGYPVNLAYHSGARMDEEASWVGLGWSLTPGAVNRELRGLPDDFCNTEIKREYNTKANKTIGIQFGGNLEILSTGGSKIKGTLGGGITFFRNSITGYGLTLNAGGSINAGGLGKGNSGLGVGLDMSAGTQDGLCVSPSLNSTEDNGTEKKGYGLGANFNSRSGFRGLTFTRINSETLKYNKDQNKDVVTNDSKESVDVTTQLGGSSSLSFDNTVYSQDQPANFTTFAFNFTGKVGIEAFPINPNLMISGFFSETKVAKQIILSNAYGYLKSDQSLKDPIASFDFNTENATIFTTSVPNLPLSYGTFDLFDVSGEGMNGQFRAHRGDIGILKAPFSSSVTTSVDAGVEVGIGGNLIKVGGNIQAVVGFSGVLDWSQNNEMRSKVAYLPDSAVSDPHYERNFFVKSGELMVNETDFDNQIFNNDLLRINIPPRADKIAALSGIANRSFDRYEGVNGNFIATSTVSNQIKRNYRSRRSTSFTYLTSGEASLLGSGNYIRVFAPNEYFFGDSLNPNNGRSNVNAYMHTVHPSTNIAEINVHSPDGKKYVYGLPDYNNTQIDASFSVTHPTSYPTDGLISYSSPDNSTANTKGKDNYFNRVTTPGYANSFLLTGVYSPNYIDRLKDGPTYDDVGTWVKFNYAKVQSDYRWRMPYKLNKAKYNEGLKSIEDDDKASYFYGSKEIWNLHSIDSKNFVAVFITSPRNDACGVTDENGGMDSTKALRKLDEIRLYNRADLFKNKGNAVAIKVVHFEYDYQLCPGIDNNKRPLSSLGSGKLTLKKIYFTYASSNKGVLNSYQFTYPVNKNYDINSYDRWGSYRDNSLSTYPQTYEFPYTLQDTTLTNNASRAWNLGRIDLPSGGVIQINYESKDYAYVQDRRATQMFFIEKFGNSADPSLADETLYSSKSNNRSYAFIKVPIGVTTKAQIEQKYLFGLNTLYYKCLVNLKGSKQEFVSGYVDFWEYGTTSNPNLIWIRLKDTKEEKGSFFANPISVTGWQFMRTQTPDLIYPGSTNMNGDPIKLIKSLISVFGEAKQLFTGFDNVAVSPNKEYAKRFDKTKSWIRLDNPNYKKLGGGSRVSAIAVKDNWYKQTNSAQSEGTYTTVYDYTTDVIINGTTTSISSGVATYEPTIGADENPFKLPIKYANQISPCGPTNKLFQEEPIGESLFPAASIGYSRVKVKNIIPGSSNTSTGNGFEVNEFYTAKDFPSISGYVDKNVSPTNNKKASYLLNLYVYDYLTASQGFYVEVNDMHGKSKSNLIYNESGALISGQRFYYRKNAQGKLDNNVQCINQKGEITTEELGVQRDVWVNMQEESSQSLNAAVQINSDNWIIPAGIIPLFFSVPPVMPWASVDITRFRSATTTKFVNRSAILDSIQYITDGATLTEKNLLYDKETGSVVSSGKTDEYNETIYSFKYPAYWINQNMGPEYSSINTVLKDIRFINGAPFLASGSSASIWIQEGDVLVPATAWDYTKILFYRRFNGPNYEDGIRFWVSKVGSSIYVHDDLGNPIDLPGALHLNLKVYQSGRKNMQSLDGGGFTTVNTKPFNSTGMVTSSLKIKDLTATEYTDKWKLDCQAIPEMRCDSLPTTDWNVCLSGLIKNITKYDSIHHTNIWYQPQPGPLSLKAIYNAYGPICEDSLGGVPIDSVYWSPPSNLSAIVNSPAIIHLGPNYFLTIDRLDASDSVYLDSLNVIQDPHGNCLLVNSKFSTQHYDICIYGMNCRTICEDLRSTAMNPIREGIYNNWHAKNSWVYHSTRVANAQATAKSSGQFDIYTLPYTYSTSHQKWEPGFSTDSLNWIKSTQTTKIIKSGEEIENIDPLGNYSAALYGFTESVPIQVSKNAKYKEIYFSSFEDSKYKTDNTICKGKHWSNEPDFQGSLSSWINSDTVHTGRQSVRIPNLEILTYESKIQNEVSGDPATWHGAHYYLKNDSTCFPLVSLKTEKKYLVNYWLNIAAECTTESYDNICTITFLSSGSSPIGSPVYPVAISPIIDGWQQFEAEFTVPGAYNKMKIEFSGGNNVYIDDFRLCPLSSQSKCFVYNNINLRLMAELDENHYATFYEYNEEGQLIRLKKETERGIMTLKETRENQPRLK